MVCYCDLSKHIFTGSCFWVFFAGAAFMLLVVLLYISFYHFGKGGA